jgi:hypothetical protein
MRRWVKFTLVGVALATVAFLALAGTGAYYFFRHLNVRTVAEAETRTDFEAVRVRYAGRPQLVEVRNLKSGDLVVNKTAHPQGLRATTVHVMAWGADDHKLIRTDLPLWLMRFSSINILSHLGVVPSKYRLTADDLATYGPGIVVDSRQPGSSQVLIWLE